MMIRALVPALVLSTVAACAGGLGNISVPAAACPKITGTPPDLGPVTTQATTESVAIELHQAYMRARVRSQLEQSLPPTATRQQLQIPEGSPGFIPSGGIQLNSVDLEEKTENGARVNLLAIGLSPWLRNQTADPADPSGNTFKLNQAVVSTRRFTLRLALNPHLVTPTTVTDLQKRRLALGCDPGDQDCSGVALSLGFYELYDTSFGEKVVCSDGPGTPARSRNYDVVSAQVLQGALDTVNGKVIPAQAGDQPTVIPAQPPITIPTKDILGMVNAMTSGPPLSFSGVAVGSDQHLRIGLLLSGGTPAPFSSTAGFRNADVDWAVLIDTSFISAKIGSDATSQAAMNTPAVTLTSVSTTFAPGRLDVSGSGTVTTGTLSCTVPISVTLSVTPSVCRSSAGASTLRICPGDPKANPTATVCAVFDQIFAGIGSTLSGLFSRGMATANISCSTCKPCTNNGVQFSVGPNDTFYGTTIDTAGAFYLSGRSTLMDASLAASGRPRSALPASCP